MWWKPVKWSERTLTVFDEEIKNVLFFQLYPFRCEGVEKCHQTIFLLQVRFLKNGNNLDLGEGTSDWWGGLRQILAWRKKNNSIEGGYLSGQTGIFFHWHLAPVFPLNKFLSLSGNLVSHFSVIRSVNLLSNFNSSRGGPF